MAFEIFFIIATFFHLNIKQINVQIAFLYTLITQFIYINISKIVQDRGKLRYGL